MLRKKFGIVENLNVNLPMKYFNERGRILKEKVTDFFNELKVEGDTEIYYSLNNDDMDILKEEVPIYYNRLNKLFYDMKDGILTRLLTGPYHSFSSYTISRLFKDTNIMFNLDEYYEYTNISTFYFYYDLLQDYYNFFNSLNRDIVINNIPASNTILLANRHIREIKELVNTVNILIEGMYNDGFKDFSNDLLLNTFYSSGKNIYKIVEIQDDNNLKLVNYSNNSFCTFITKLQLLEINIKNYERVFNIALPTFLF